MAQRYRALLLQFAWNTSLGLVDAFIGTDRFKLSEFSKDKEFYLALRWYFAVLTAEPDFLACRESVPDREFPKSVQL